VWFTEQTGNKIGRITTAGVITGEFVISTAGSSPVGIVTGADGNLWFTESRGHRIARISSTGAITESGAKQSVEPFGIAAGPAGTMWFTDPELGGAIGEFRIP